MSVFTLSEGQRDTGPEGHGQQRAQQEHETPPATMVLPDEQPFPVYDAEAPGPSPLPHGPAAGERDRIPKLFDHTLSPDFSQYNHLLISSARNPPIPARCDHDALYRRII